MSEFFVGQKVVCVDADNLHCKNGEMHPDKDVIYTIREILQRPNDEGCYLVEIVNAPRSYTDTFSEKGWYTWRFRPLDSKAISIFRQIAQDVTAGKIKEFTEC